jgi:hypothetical protein
MTLDYLERRLSEKWNTSSVPQEASTWFLSDISNIGSTTYEKQRHDQGEITTDENRSMVAFFSEQTTDEYTLGDEDFLKLQAAHDQILYNHVPTAVFAQLIGTIDWRNKSARFLKQTVELALELGLPTVAFGLAETGYEMHPTDNYLERAVRVLAPPEITERNRPAQKGLSASMLWLRNHAEDYQATWVALQDGELIDSASTRRELVSKLGSVTDNSSVLITRIP